MENTTLRYVDDEAFCGTSINTLILTETQSVERSSKFIICIEETLMHLDLSDNVIRHINSSLAYLAVLETLNISNNGLEYTAYNSLCGTNLTTLNLNRGGESNLPVAHPGYQVLSDILFRLSLIANALTQCSA